MFKYFCHQNNSWPSHTRLNWEPIEPESYDDPVTDFKSAIEWLKVNEWWVWDCDGGSTFNYRLGLSNGTETKYYLVTHDFTAYWGEEGFQVDNFFEVSEIPKAQAFVPDDRDWLNLKHSSAKWPPKQEI